MKNDGDSRDDGADAAPRPQEDKTIKKKKSKAEKAKKADGDKGAEEPEVMEAEAPPEAAQAEVDRLNDRLLRLQADFENYRKRVLRERNELYRNAAQDVVTELLPVLDHLDLALKASAEHGADDAFHEGLVLLSNQLTLALGKTGLEAIDAEGEAFDTTFHEAVSYLPHEAVAEGHVVAQTRRGYRIGDKLLRPAQVVVSSGPADAAGDGDARTESAPTAEA